MLTANAVTSLVTVSFTTAGAIPEGGTITMQLPDDGWTFPNFNATINNTAFPNVSLPDFFTPLTPTNFSFNSNVNWSYTTRTLTIVTNATIPSGEPVSFTLTNATNPPSVRPV